MSTTPQGQAPLTLSPDGEWYWDGVVWHPVAHVATPAPQVFTPHLTTVRTWTPPPPEPRGPKVARALGVVALLAILAAASYGVLMLLGVVGSESAGSRQEQALAAMLRNAGRAQDTYLLEYGTFATDPQALLGNGVELGEGVELRVVRADATSFCLAAGPAGGAPTAWITQAGTVSGTPCG